MKRGFVIEIIFGYSIKGYFYIRKWFYFMQWYRRWWVLWIRTIGHLTHQIFLKFIASILFFDFFS